MSVQGCATVQIHKCLGVQMYRCTSAYECTDRCIGVQVYGCAGVQVYGCTGMYNCIGEYCYFYFKIRHEIFPEFRNFLDLGGHSRGNPRSGLIFMGGGVPYIVCAR